jgi:NAD(P)-dependent dehydrogenase (short-subunit alcohol dehydrogenase family)
MDDNVCDGQRFVRADVSREPDVEATIQTALDAFGRLDCMFNNAGIGDAFGPIIETRAGRGGAIISTTSVAAFTGGCAHCYSAARAAIVSLTRTVSSRRTSSIFRNGPRFVSAVTWHTSSRGARRSKPRRGRPSANPRRMARRLEHAPARRAS